MHKKKPIITGLVLLFMFVAVFGGNYFILQYPVNKGLSEDPRNEGIQIWVHWSMFINPSRLILDLRKVGLDKAPADVFRCLNHVAAALSTKDFATVELQFKGKSKFLLEGSYFKTLGEEYGLQNPVYTIRTFPENVKKMDGSAAFSSWSGGMLGVLQKQMEDFSEFNKQWYIDDLFGQ